MMTNKQEFIEKRARGILLNKSPVTLGKGEIKWSNLFQRALK